MDASHKLSVSLLMFFLSILSINGQEEINFNKPGARWGHVLVYYPTHNQLVLFGGASERGKYHNDTWIWKNSKWGKMAVEGPASRGFSAVAFHEVRKTIILHGGRGNEKITYSDTWEWNGNNWKQLDTNGNYQADHHQMVYVPSKNELVAFGGWNGKGVSGNTWIWSEKWIKSNETSPPSRASFGMTYNYSSNQIILFGGLWINGQYADLWQRKNGTWSRLGGHYDHSSLDHHSMFYDKGTNQVIIFGGKNYRNKMQQKTLAVNGSEIIELITQGPSARHSTNITYHH